MSSAKHILLISHDDSRTGAPILLLNLAAAIQASGSFRISFLLKRKNGDLYDRFAAIAPVFVASTGNHGRGRVARALARRLQLPAFSDKEIMAALAGVDVVISNTITNGDILPHVRKYFNGPVLSYIHELEMAAQYFTGPELIRRLLDCTDRFLVPSLAVKEYLVRGLQIREDSIDLFPYYIPPESIAANETPDRKTGARPTLTVGASGTTDWRKAPELFIALAAIVRSKLPSADIRFCWKGAMPDSLELRRLMHDVEKAALNDRVFFLPASDRIGEFYREIDLFVLTSREDPYPLVVLEAANMERPTLCFRESGGAAEFVEEDAGAAIPYMDLSGMAEKILFYYEHRAALEEAGRIARRKLIERHQRPDTIIARLKTLLGKQTRHETA